MASMSRKLAKEIKDPDHDMQVLSKAHVSSAIFRAVNDYLNERLKSRNVHSEIVFSFSPTNNVG